MKWASCCGVRSRRFLRVDVEYLLSQWASTQIEAIATLSGSSEIAALSGAALIGMRTKKEAPRSCQFYAAKDGHVALNLARPDDIALLPALFGKIDAVIESVPTDMLQVNATDIVAQGRALGLAIAHLDERPASPACEPIAHGIAARKSSDRPLVVDLSALWAGPLAAHLLGLTGFSVIKAESSTRPDALREGDPDLFARLNDGKAQKRLDFHTNWGRDALIALIRYADIVIEAARPRALLQLGIDADALVAAIPGLVWVTITGHGVRGDAANWIGYGDDCGVAGGLSAALFEATGEVDFVGEAIADPLTGIYAARVALEQRDRRTGARLALSMSAIAAKALNANASSC